MKKYYNMTKNEVLESVHSTEKGICFLEAKKRLEQFGPNEIQEGQKKKIWMVFLEQFRDFLVLILMGAALISLFLGNAESALVILVVVLINAVLGTVQYQKAEQSLDSLKALSSPAAKVLREGKKNTIDSKEVVPGDIICLEAGDYICADGRILENFSLKINESSLTGESVSVEKETEAISENAAIGDRKNMVFSGSFVTYGRGVYVATGTGMDTEIGKVAQLLKSTQSKKTPLQENLDQFGKKLSILILIVCAILFALSIWRGESIINAFLFAVALAVAAIPEALSSIVTIVLSFGTQKMAKENAIIRKLHAVEGLGSVSIICSDKTGTLTQNKMTVKKYCINNKMIEEQEADFQQPQEKELILMGILCNDSSNQEGKEIGDPTEVALINFGDKHGFEDTEIKKQYTRLGEIPFDSDRKLMSTVHLFDGQKRMITKGAVDVLLDRVKAIKKENSIQDFTEQDRKELEKINQTFSESGLRVLAFAYRDLDEKTEINLEEEKDYCFLGLIAMMDPPREESKEAVSECIQAGIRPIMITGDHKVTAAAIAKEIGILKEGEKAVDGAEIDGMTEEELQKYVEDISVYARVSPEHKIRIVHAWQEKGNIVAMTGDGVNDAPALKQADIGVAMGITGSEVAKDAASMVLTDDNFATIVKAVENGRNLYQNIKNSIQFLLSGNTAGILAVLYASLMGLTVPFAPVHLLFINLLTDSLPAIALGMEPHKKEVMKEKPRPIGESIMTKDFIRNIVIQGVVIAAATMVAFYTGMRQGGAGVASTMAFSTLCLCRLLHGFSCKGKKPVILSKKLFDNQILWIAFIIGFLLLNCVLLIPALHGIFEVENLALGQLLLVYGFSFGSFLLIQVWKAITARKA